MKNRLGVEMTILGYDDRTKLMRGMILRRLDHGNPLVKHQLDTAIEQDISEIKKRFPSFDFESYVGSDLETFYKAMQEEQLLGHRDGKKEALFERGSLADEFVAELPEELGYMVEDLPMSTRGLFDSLKSRPDKDRQVTVSSQDFVNRHSTGNKHVVVDHDPEDKGHSQPGPVIPQG